MSIGPKAGKKDNSRRRYPGKGGARHNPVTADIKAKEAKERQEAWSKMSPQEQLKALDTRLGKGVGAAKQRARLQALNNNPKRPVHKGEVKHETSHIKAKDRRADEQSKRPSK